MKKAKKEQTIGDWLKANPDVSARNNAHWEVFRTPRETYAVVKMRTWLLRNSEVIAVAHSGIVWRGQSVPRYEQWLPNSQFVKEASEAVETVKSIDTSDLPVTAFTGFNHVMPWEKPEPPRLSIWTRLKLWWLARGL